MCLLFVLLSLSSKIDSAGQVNGNSKRTAASNRLMQAHLAVSHSNTATSIELLEMKERICAGFRFRAYGINCTFQIPTESVAISPVFGECRQIMIAR